ncbi:MAG: 5-oxoprolinase subunit PxpB [bacterium]
MIDPHALRIVPLGDRGLIVELGDALAPEVNARVRALAGRLRGLPGVEEAVPTLRSVLVIFDPLSTDMTLVAESVERHAAALPVESGTVPRVIEVPVVYGGGAGPDLEEVAAGGGLTPDQAVRAHREVQYTVYMLGFTPGFPYLGILPEALRAPRLPSPRLRVPPGSIGIADVMTGIYPLSSPGGWRLIGRTPLPIYDAFAPDPVLLRPGDRVQFVPVQGAQFPELPQARPLRTPDHAVLEVRTPGLFTTIQDRGRSRYRSLGIPPAGAMDPLALGIANAAVGNASDASALEFTAPGPALRVLDQITAAISGADLSAAVDGRPLERNAPVTLRPGQMIEFGAPRAGVWGYLAIAGSFEARRVLGSSSTFVPGMLGGSAGRRLRAGDVLGTAGVSSRRGRTFSADSVPLPRQEMTVRVIPGPQDEWLTEEARAGLLKEVYRISLNSDRAGARLSGRALAHRTTGDFLSDGVLPGAIQVPSGGEPIVIMPDGPTTGGYPKAAAVISADVRFVAQARPGTQIRFRAVTMDEALDALRRERESYGQPADTR